ncbi:MAG: DUF3488 and transglutaminase-like domain-containing protein [Deltaproteobacteria bacterium]
MNDPGGRPFLPRTPWILLRAHWIAGLLPLFALTEISRPGLAAATAAFLLGAWLDRSGRDRTAWNRFATPLGLGTILLAAADLYAGSRDLLSAITLLVLCLQSVKFLLPKTLRDGWQLCAIAFLEFLAAAASTTRIQFAGFLFLFLALSIGAMWALHLDEEAASRERPPEIRPGFPIRLVGLSAVAGFLLTALLFLVIPRIGIGHLLRHLDRPGGLTGFSDAIPLGGVTSIKADRSVAARIEFPDPAPGVDPTSLYLKGSVFPRFDGTRWTRSEDRGTAVPRSGSFYFPVSVPPGEPLSTAEVYLEPAGHRRLLVYGVPVAIEGMLGPLRVDSTGIYRFPLPVYSALRYRIRFAAKEPARRKTAPPPGKELLEIPPGLEEVRALSARIAAGAASPREAANRFLRHLRSEYRYTLTDAAPTVRDFLFVRKAGFCEHYATGLALLLRAAGVPARVAAGYYGGEWSDLGDYLIIRQSDAHAWTEAWIDGRWETLDATPPAEGILSFSARTGILGFTLDWARQQWNKYVVNYSLRMQAEAVSQGWRAVRRSPWTLRRLLEGGRLAENRRTAGIFLAIVPAALLGGLLAKRRRSRGSSAERSGAALPRAYSRLVRRLAANGFRRSPGTPMQEMLDRAVAKRPSLAEPAGDFLRLYHRDRFGAVPLREEEARAAARLADTLRRELSAVREAS